MALGATAKNKSERLANMSICNNEKANAYLKKMGGYRSIDLAPAS